MSHTSNTYAAYRSSLAKLPTHMQVALTELTKQLVGAEQIITTNIRAIKVLLAASNALLIAEQQYEIKSDSHIRVGYFKTSKSFLENFGAEAAIMQSEMTALIMDTGGIHDTQDFVAVLMVGRPNLKVSQDQQSGSIAYIGCPENPLDAPFVNNRPE